MVLERDNSENGSTSFSICDVDEDSEYLYEDCKEIKDNTVINLPEVCSEKDDESDPESSEEEKKVCD